MSSIMFESPMGGKSLKRARSDSVDSRGSSPRRESDVLYATSAELTVEEKKGYIIRAKIENMTDEQRDRFEFFTRSHFDKEVIKKSMVDAFANIKAGLTDGMREEARNKPVDVTEKMVIVTGALCKLFVGDLVRDAVAIRNERGEEGPICPRHIREAYRRAVRSKRLPVLRGTSITDLPR